MARRKLWVPIQQGSNVTASNTAQINLLSNLAVDLEALGGLTVIRIVGQVSFHINTVGIYQQVVMSIGVFHENIGSTTVLAGSESLDLMWTLLARTTGGFIEVAAGDFDAVEDKEYVNVRSQRKLKPNEGLYLHIENPAGSQTLEYNVGLRTLVLLP